jgi:hypothetical protein
MVEEELEEIYADVLRRNPGESEFHQGGPRRAVVARSGACLRPDLTAVRRLPARRHGRSRHSGAMWRSFDVGAVVEALPVSDASVAAGAGGMARPVRRARLAATPDDLRRVAANELIVTTA